VAGPFPAATRGDWLDEAAGGGVVETGTSGPMVSGGGDIDTEVAPGSLPSGFGVGLMGEDEAECAGEISDTAMGAEGELGPI